MDRVGIPKIKIKNKPILRRLIGFILLLLFLFSYLIINEHIKPIVKSIPARKSIIKEAFELRKPFNIDIVIAADKP